MTAEGIIYIDKIVKMIKKHYNIPTIIDNSLSIIPYIEKMGGDVLCKDIDLSFDTITKKIHPILFLVLKKIKILSIKIII